MVQMEMLFVIFILIASAFLLVALSFKRPIFCLLPIAMVLNLDEFGNIFNTLLTIQQVTGVFALLMFFIGLSFYKKNVIVTKFALRYLILICYFFLNYFYISTFTNYIPGFEYAAPLAWFNYFLMMIIVPYFVECEEDIKLFLNYVSLGMAFVVILGILQFIFGESLLPYSTKGFRDGGIHQVRITSVFLDPNRLSSVLLLFIPIGIYLYVTSVGMFKCIGGFNVIGGFFILVNSLSRAGYVGLLFLLATYLLLERKFKAFILSGFLGIAIFGLSFFVSDEIVDRLNIHSAISDPSNLIRFTSWSGGFNVFSESPLFGVGLGNYYVNSPRFGSFVKNSIENLPLSLLVETGLIGLSIFAYIMYTNQICLYRNFKFRKDLLSKSLLLSSVGYLGFSLFHNYIQQSFFWFILILGDLQTRFLSEKK